MVALAAAGGVLAAATVAPPADLPSVSLRAVAVYRAEVGAAVFLALYLASIALVLAMHNRGFTELGTGGVRASDLADLEGAAVDEFALEGIEEIRELLARREEREDVSRETLGHS